MVFMTSIYPGHLLFLKSCQTMRTSNNNDFQPPTTHIQQCDAIDILSQQKYNNLWADCLCYENSTYPRTMGSRFTKPRFQQKLPVCPVLYEPQPLCVIVEAVLFAGNHEHAHFSRQTPAIDSDPAEQNHLVRGDKIRTQQRVKSGVLARGGRSGRTSQLLGTVCLLYMTQRG